MKPLDNTRSEKMYNARLQSAAKRLLKLFGPKGEHWSHGLMAADKFNNPVDRKSRQAVKWCLSGAIEKLRMTQMYVPLSRNAGQDLVAFNDKHKTYTHVKRFLTKLATPTPTPTKKAKAKK